jgi:hypothetical protein
MVTRQEFREAAKVTRLVKFEPPVSAGLSPGLDAMAETGYGWKEEGE